MPAHWKTLAREAGFDPRRVKEAPYSFGKLEVTIGLDDMKGAVIGDGCRCSGAKAIKRVFDADWAHVGATAAHIVPKGSKTILRFLVNGMPSKQDRTMNVMGEKLILRPPAKTDRLKYKVARNADYRANGPATRKNKPRERSLIGQLREN